MRELYRKEEIEHIDKVPAQILRQTLEGDKCFVPMHWHKDIEINLMLYGKGIFTVNGQTSELSPGDFIIINSGDLHKGEAEPDIPLQKCRQELITIQLDYDFLNHYFENGQKIKLRMPGDEAITEKIRELIVEIGLHFKHKELGYKMDITANLLQIGSLLLRNCVVQGESQEEYTLQNKIKEMQLAVAYIDSHCSEDLTLNDVAEYVHLAPAYFSRRFRQITGNTYHDYLTFTRLKRSIQDILDTNLTITEIAFQNGFPNVRAFINAFKRQYQMTPQKYRKEYGGL